MASFGKPVITENGLNLLARALAGDVNIEFTHIAFGSGFYTEDETAPEILQKASGLKEEKQKSYFSSKEIIDSSRIKLKALVSNETLVEGYYINEIGIFAKVRGEDDESAILYSVAVADIADYMPKYNGNRPKQIIQEYYTAVHNAENITIIAANSTVALAEDLNKHIADEECHITPDERSNWEKTYQAVLYITDTANIVSAFETVFTLTEMPVDETALTLEDIDQAILTPWNGESSSDPTALSSEEIEDAISTPWNGESSADETALSAEEIGEIIG